MNKFGIPNDVLMRTHERDQLCVYCGKPMVRPYSRANVADSATIEHLRETAPFHWADGLVEEDIVVCCGACNSSRGTKPHSVWFENRYCNERGINTTSVAEPVKKYLKRTQ